MERLRTIWRRPSSGARAAFDGIRTGTREGAKVTVRGPADINRYVACYNSVWRHSYHGYYSPIAARENRKAYPEFLSQFKAGVERIGWWVDVPLKFVSPKSAAQGKTGCADIALNLINKFLCIARDLKTSSDK